MTTPDTTPIPLDKALDLSGKTAIVTGASRGIGAAIAERLAQAGAFVYVGFREQADAADEVVARIQAAGGEAEARRGDVTKRVDVEALVSAAGEVDIVVNNAGTYPLHGLLEMTDHDFDAVVASNLRSVHLMTQVAAKVMKPGASIVNIASIEAVAPAPAHAHYDAAKAAVVMHTRAAALELGAKGIRVNAVSPGLIWYPALPDLWPEGVKRYEEAAPLGRLGTGADVADAVLYLASPMARFVTGANLVVDGGVLATPAF